MISLPRQQMEDHWARRNDMFEIWICFLDMPYIKFVGLFSFFTMYIIKSSGTQQSQDICIQFIYTYTTDDNQNVEP